ncbi:hypothetical protein YB2330_005514 [Saitoella coloradoensis]
MSTIPAIPAIGYGTGTAWYKGPNDPLNKDLISSIKSALHAGFTHLDCAEVYNTETEVGQAIKESGVDRSKLFITTKVITNIADPIAALRTSLRKLGTDYVDLYLIHAPFFATKPNSPNSLLNAWSSLIDAQQQGLTKAIGVSNFRIQDLEELKKSPNGVKPGVNQIEYHPCLQQEELVGYMNKEGIKIVCYSPLAPITRDVGTGAVKKVAEGIADKHGKTAGQVLLKWSLQKDHILITTSAKPSRMTEQLAAASPDWSLTEEESQEIEKAGAKPEEHFRAFWREEMEGSGK